MEVLKYPVAEANNNSAVVSTSTTKTAQTVVGVRTTRITKRVERIVHPDGRVEERVVGQDTTTSNGQIHNQLIDVDGKQMATTRVEGSFPGITGSPSREMALVSGRGEEAGVGGAVAPVVGDWGLALGPEDGDIASVLAQTQARFQTMLDSAAARFRDKYGDLFAGAVQGGVPGEPGGEAGDGGDYEETTYVDEEGRRVTKRVRRHHQSVQFRSQTKVVEGKPAATRTRATLRYQGPEGGYQLNFLDAPDVDSEDEEAEMDEDDLWTTHLLALPAPRAMPARPKPPTAPSVISEAPSDAATITGLEPTAQSASKTEKAWMAAKELVDTEERYVRKLELLDQEFRTRVEALKGSSGLSKDAHARLFSNLSSIYQFHNSHFLPPLLDRMREWQSRQTISDVIVRLAPWLKMYSEYTSNYQRAMKTLEEGVKKSRALGRVVAEVEALPEADSLPLASHLICPVQRVMRYHLLLEAYLKALGPDHPDRKDTEEALAAVLAGAEHANQVMRRLEGYKEVMGVAELLGLRSQLLVTPSRELVKDAQLNKISASGGTREPRRLFLFNDLLIMASSRKIPTSLHKLKLRASIRVEDLELELNDRLDLPNHFIVADSVSRRRIGLEAKSWAEKEKWLKLLHSVKADLSSKTSTLKTEAGAAESPRPASVASPGRDVKASKGSILSARIHSCGGCGGQLKKSLGSLRRPKSCKQCGRTFCSKCRGTKLRKEAGGKKAKHCVDCEAAGEAGGERGPESAREEGGERRVLLEGQLEISSRLEKEWRRRRVVVEEVGRSVLLSVFPEDGTEAEKPLATLPLLGCSAQPSPAPQTFRLSHQGRDFLLRAPDDQAMTDWVALLSLSAALPPNTPQ